MRASLNAFDLLLPPGGPLTLRARVHRTGIMRSGGGVPGLRVAFEGAGVRADAVTDGHGYAEVAAGKAVPGIATYDVRAAEGPGNGTRIVVLGLPADAPILVTDIDRTISDASSWTGAIRSIERVHPLPHSVEVLSEAARRYAIVYLTARNQRFMWRTREWLTLRGFPPGPIFFRQVLFWRARSGTYKRLWLRDLTRRYTRVMWGIGDRRSDAKAYAAANIPPILIGRRRRDRKGICEVRGWADISRVIGAPLL